jgi:hypothetical protein
MIDLKIKKLNEDEVRIHLNGYIDCDRNFAAQVTKDIFEDLYQQVIDKYLKKYHPTDKIYYFA